MKEIYLIKLDNARRYSTYLLSTVVRRLLFWFFLLAAFSSHVYAAEPFIRTYLFSIAQENDLLNEPLADIKKFNLINARRDQACRYNGVADSCGARNTLWEEFKTSGTDKQVYLYSHGADSNSNQDSVVRNERTTQGRVFSPISGDSPPTGSFTNQSQNSFNTDFGLCSVSTRPCPLASRSISTPANVGFLFEFGNANYQTMFSEALINDLNETTGEGADGFHFDNTEPNRCSAGCTPSPINAGYTTTAGWTANIQSFWQGISEKATGVKIQADFTTTPEAITMVTALDDVPAIQRPDQFGWEFAFIIATPTAAPTQIFFRNGTVYENLINMYLGITNTEVAVMNCAVTDQSLGIPATVDQNLDTVDEERMLWYAVASYALVKRDSPKWYFGCYRNEGAAGLPWFAEYDSMLNTDGVGNMALGDPITTAQKVVSGSASFYYRKFVNGAVFVNHSNATATIDVQSLLADTVKVLTRANLLTAPASITTVNSISIPRLNARFVRYASGPQGGGTPEPPPAPTGTRLQINIDIRHPADRGVRYDIRSDQKLMLPNSWVEENP